MYVSLGCAWAHRTAIIWKLQGLEDVISLLIDYPHLWNYLKDLYQQPKVREVCNLDHIKRIYYQGLPQLNPNQIIPVGPLIDLDTPHDR